jgi:hypothetical protein
MVARKADTRSVCSHAEYSYNKITIDILRVADLEVYCRSQGHWFEDAEARSSLQGARRAARDSKT